MWCCGTKAGEVVCKSDGIMLINGQTIKEV